MLRPATTTNAPIDAAFALLTRDDAGARGSFESLFHAVADDPARALRSLSAAGVLLGIAADFSDFRGLAIWLQRFAVDQDAAWATWPRDEDQARIAAARLVAPLLDEAHGTDDDAVVAAARHLTALLARPLAVTADERILLSKCLIDYSAHCCDVTAIVRISAQVQDFLREGTVSPQWQARWWLLMASNHEYFGADDAAADALGRAARLAEAHDLPRIRYELLCVEMNNALKVEHWSRAEVIAREIEKALPDVRAGRLPAGLRAQATRLLWVREPAAALQRLERLMAICDDTEVPPRDRGP